MSPPTWRSRTLSRLQDAFPKLKRLVGRKSKKGRKALLKLFEGQRRDIVDGLRAEQGHGNDDKVTNLQALLSLPLELSDLETCLQKGVAGALSCETTIPPNSKKGIPPLNLSQIDADAEFLAKFVVGDQDNATDTDTGLTNPSTTTTSQARELLETLRTPPNAIHSATHQGTSLRVGSMAQLTALVLMVAQILIGAQLLRRYRKRKTTNQANTQDRTSTPSAIPSGAHRNPRRTSSDPTVFRHERGRSRSPGRSTGRRRSRSRSRSRLDDDAPTSRSRRRSRSRSRPRMVGPPPPLSPTPSARRPRPTRLDDDANTTPKPTLDEHLDTNQNPQDNATASSRTCTSKPSNTTTNNATSNRNKTSTQQHATPEHDDNGTAETDSLSLSEGQPQTIKEDQRQHSHSNSNTIGKTNTNAAATTAAATATPTNPQDVLALLSFEGSTRTQLDQGRKQLPTPAFAQDKFALRMTKLKNELFHVKQEQKNQLKDSTHHIQLRYQETNKQYQDLTKRLQNLTASIHADPQSAPIVTKVRARSPLLRPPSPEQLQAQANIQANNEERAKLLGKVSTLQQDLKNQQERHLQDLQQREATLQQMNSKIQFLSHELERRVLHARAIEAELQAKRKQEGQVGVTSQEVVSLKQQQRKLSEELQATKQRFNAKERECQDLLQKLRAVPPPSASNTSTQNEAAAEEHAQLMKELERQLQQQDQMNRKTLEMTQMLESKRCEVIERTKHLEQMSQEVEARRAKVEAMEAADTAQSPAQALLAQQSTEELEKELEELQSRYESQSLECEKLNEIVTAKSKLLHQKEEECHQLASRLEEMTCQLQEKEAQIEQLEQDVQDKQDLAAQNEAITNELQVQQELQEKMNQTTLQMIQLLEEKEQSNADLTNKLEALTEELNHSKGILS